jgi:hypothetical protein
VTGENYWSNGSLGDPRSVKLQLQYTLSKE